MQFPHYSRPERIVDGIVHVAGISAGLVAGIVLAVVAISRGEGVHTTGLGLYGFGLVAMLVCSALYNMTAEGWWKGFYRRLDHAAIFLMIAGTYTPFALLAIGGKFGMALLAFVWLIAAVGILVKLTSRTRREKLSIATYLLLGWTIVVALDPLLAAVSLPGVVLLLIGGILYSVGVVFHKWTGLPYNNAIWHLFVLAAASCHFVAVLTDVALAN
ncbi:MAG: PAQR family membrane homeostasis protein TrhA [Geminicoccaceae bacterium]